MKSVINDGTVGVNNAELIGTTGWSIADALDEALSTRLDAHRYGTLADRVLARYEDVDARFPGSEELKAMGVDIVRLADALDAGLDADLFGKVLGQGLDIDGLNATLENGIDIPSFNEGLSHLVDVHELHQLHPDPVDRTMHLHGECSCAQ
jgi:hypothetical protein